MTCHFTRGGACSSLINWAKVCSEVSVDISNDNELIFRQKSCLSLSETKSVLILLAKIRISVFAKLNRWLKIEYKCIDVQCVMFDRFYLYHVCMLQKEAGICLLKDSVSSGP